MFFADTGPFGGCRNENNRMDKVEAGTHCRQLQMPQPYNMAAIVSRWKLPNERGSENTGMTRAQLLFLTRYYAANLLHVRVGWRINQLFLRQYEPRWRELRSSIAGHDAWLVVGNGPSLRVQDLEALRGIPAIASNKINLLYSKTDWRPTLYTVTDPLLMFKFPREHYDNIPLTLSTDACGNMARTDRRLLWRLIWNDAGEEMYVKGSVELSPMNGIVEGATVTCPNIQLGIWAGAKVIYLIGCDHFYAAEEHKEGVRKMTSEGVSNHFDPNYRKPGEIVNSAPVDAMNRGYALIHRIAKKRGVRIINISRSSHLQEFERSTVEEALAEIEASNSRSRAIARA